MEATDRTAFGQALSALGVAFGKEVDAAILEVYWGLLCDLDVSAVVRGFGAAGRTLKWFPKPAEIRELSGESVEAKAIEAWEAVRTAVRRHGYTHSVDFGPLVNAVVRNLGGWIWLTDQTTDAMPFVRKDFERIYGLLAAAPLEGLHGASLAGAFGGEPVRVQIGNAPPATRGALPEQRGPAADSMRQLVADLAERADYP